MRDLKLELTRSMNALSEATPGTETHARLVASVDTLMRLIWSNEGICVAEANDPDLSVPDSRTPDEAATWGPGGGEAVEPETPPTVTLTKDEVKAKLLALSGKCDALDIAAVMEGMGYSKLSDIPAARYAELLENADAAVKELVS